ncbi:MAG TPA: endonuclease/exonuclease/phosphatase family protein [Spirochaetales bacterium]|nr:endonuclease/exonuclease/phosphatase family protein [Spirochaetales bacterium]HPB66234.1 endonuclease/exonuclease/phosphatase family protein [Spirochaetales bacterium]HPG86504.1 endonuclease/exonuclease/phosphatase family protein [Spirochaetales bacterium]
MPETYTIASFNAENFSMLLDADYGAAEFHALSDERYAAMNPSIFNPNKDRAKASAIASTILERDFDVVGLCEIGGMETLENFNRYYLGGRYECFLHEANSRRGIFVGALVKRGRFDRIEAKPVDGPFSRNVLELRLASGDDRFRLIVVHLKSQSGQDRGIPQRVAEVRRLVEVAAPPACVVMGDFNGILIRGEAEFEYEPFLELPFRDVLEATGVPPGARFTHFYFRGAEPSFSQLDYIFCSDDVEVADGGVLAELVPLNYEQRRRLPSDHAFIWAAIRPWPVVAPDGQT